MKPLIVNMLSQYVSFIKTSLRDENKDINIVFGAHGQEFFIELATGQLNSREILLTFVIKFGGIDLDIGVTKKSIINKTEIYLQIPDYSHLIALLGLLEKSFENTTKILHPLNSTGDYLPGWSQAILTVSEKTF